MSVGPVPAVIYVYAQASEQLLVSFKQHFDRVQQQALAEAPRSRQKVVAFFVD